MQHFTSRSYSIGIILATLFIGFAGTWCIQDHFQNACSSLVFLLICVLIALAINRTLFPDIDERTQARRFLSIVLFTRVIATLLFYSTMIYDYGLPFSGQGDDSTYDFWAWELATRSLSVEGLNIPQHAITYNYIMGAIYTVFGHNILLPRFLNCLADSVTVILMYKISRRLLNKKEANLAAYLFAFFPFSIWFSSLHMRDSIVTLLIILVVWFTYLSYKHLRIRYIIALLLTVTVAYLIRDVAAYLLVASLIAVFSVDLLKRCPIKPKVRFSFVVSFVLILTIAWFGPKKEEILDSLSHKASFSIDPAARVEFRDKITQQYGQETARQSFVLSIASQDISKKPYVLPIIFLVTWIMPYPPWALIAVDKIIPNTQFIGTIAWHGLLPYFVIGVISSYKNLKEKHARFLFEVLVFLIVFTHISLTAPIWICSSTRFRMMYMPFFLIFASLGICHRKIHTKTFRLLAWSIWACPAILYIYLKYLRPCL